jgi:proline iminopeptidase
MFAIGLACFVFLGPVSAQSGAGSVRSGHFNLEYRIEGEGVPAIVIGFPKYYSRIFSSNLRSHLRMVFVDHRGTALPPEAMPMSEYSLEQISDDIELVRKELGLGSIIVIGHSGHSLMALEYAKKYPESVSHVVMIGIAPDLSDTSSDEAEAYWETMATTERKAALDRNWEGVPEKQPKETYPGESFVRTYVRNGPMAWYDYNFDSTPLWRDVDVNMEMFNHVWGTLLAEIDITQGLELLDRPVFLAVGKYDFLVAPPSSWNRIQANFRDLTMRVYDESGHSPQYEQAERFDSELLNWIEDSASD